MMDLVDRRQHAEQASADRRQRIPGHDIVVGVAPGRPGWLVGQCSCGEHAEARVEVDGVVEAWVTWHRWHSRIDS